MILADKIIYLRKQAGWSQEELAEEMNVSRQSVSKWEGAQSIPDMDKILMLSSIFGVSTDFLLKDELETLDGVSVSDSNVGVRKVSIENVTEIINTSKKVAPKIALGVFLCIVSPITLFLLSALQESNIISISSNTASTIGIIVILLLIAIAVALFIFSGIESNYYDFLEKEEFELQYGVESIVIEHKNNYQRIYIKQLITGIALCILCAVPILVLGDYPEPMPSLGAGLLLFIVACGVFLLVNTSTRWAVYQKFLKEGDYAITNTKSDKGEKIIALFSSIYWSLITVTYLIYSFISNNWEWSWIIWPIAGILFAGISGAISIFHED